MKKPGGALIVVCVFLSLTAAGLAHVRLRLEVIRLGYSITESSEERRRLEEENRKYKLERSLLRGPARIEKLAKEKLHMDRPEPSRIRTVQAP